MRQNEQDEIIISGATAVAFVRRMFVEAILFGLILGIAAYAASNWVLPPRYVAQSVLVIASPTSPSAQSVASLMDVAQPLSLNAYRAAATSDVVLASALKLLAVEKPTSAQIGALRRRLRVHPSIQENVATDVLIVDAAAAKAGEAATTANAVAASVVAWDRARSNQVVIDTVASLTKQVKSLTAQLAALQGSGASAAQRNAVASARDDLDGRLARATALQGAAGSSLSEIGKASPPPRPASPRPVLYAVVAFIIGFFLTYIVGLFLTPAGERR